MELTRAWNILTSEAQEAANWLGKDVEHVFTVPLAGVGEGSVTGKTRGYRKETSLLRRVS